MSSLLFNLDAYVTSLRRPLAPLVISMPEILLSRYLVRVLDKYTVFVLRSLGLNHYLALWNCL